MDRLARQSVDFRRGYASYPRCVPSRWALLTGKYPVTESMGDVGGIPPDQNFARAFQRIGYTVYHIGKWHQAKGVDGSASLCSPAPPRRQRPRPKPPPHAHHHSHTAPCHPRTPAPGGLLCCSPTATCCMMTATYHALTNSHGCPPPPPAAPPSGSPKTTTEGSPLAFGFNGTFGYTPSGFAGKRFHPFANQFPDLLPVSKPGDYLEDLLATEAIRYMRTADDGTPFCVMLNFYTVHGPFEAKPNDEARNGKEIAKLKYGNGAGRYASISDGVYTYRNKLRQDNPAYAGMASATCQSAPTVPRGCRARWFVLRKAREAGAHMLTHPRAPTHPSTSTCAHTQTRASRWRTWMKTSGVCSKPWTGLGWDQTRCVAGPKSPRSHALWRPLQFPTP